MRALLEKQAGAFDQCFVTKPTEWWRWTLAMATGSDLGAGSDAEIQVRWRCGTKLASANPIPLPRLCGTDVHDHTPPIGPGASWPDDCFEKGTTEEFGFEFVPGPAGTPGPFTANDYPVPECTHAGVKPVLTVYFRGDSFGDGAWPRFCTGRT